MRKILILILSIICVCTLTCCDKGNKDGVAPQEKALEIGSEILREKFPDIISEKSKFIVYKHCNVWHIQNVFLNSKTIEENKVKFFDRIKDVRYVKLNSDFTDILCVGSLEKENSEFEVYYTDDAEKIVDTVLNQIYEFRYGITGISQCLYDNENEEQKNILRCNVRTHKKIVFIHHKEKILKCGYEKVMA